MKCRLCHVAHAPTCKPYRDLRWPAEPLIETVGGVRRLVDGLHLAWGELARVRAEGLTDRQADRWAIRFGLHPCQVWPTWDEAALSPLDDVFVNGGGWRPDWLWKHPDLTVASRNASCYSASMFTTTPQGQHLITKAQAAKIPALYAQDGKGGDAIAHIRLFHPLSNWSALVLELNPATGEAFGIVMGDFTEYGYFDMNELATSQVLRLAVERDTGFAPMTVRQAVADGYIPADSIPAQMAAEEVAS